MLLKKTNIIILTLVCIVLAVSTFLYLSSTASSLSQTNSRLLSRSCGIHYSPDFDLRCYYYRTHESAGFLLPLALLNPINQDGKALDERDLLVYIPGGPGQGHMTGPDEISHWMEWLKERQSTFDVLLFDPRGTGDGKPAAQCSAYLSKVRELIATAPELSEEYRILNNTLTKCFDEYGQKLAKTFPALDQKHLYDVFATRYQAEDINGMVKSLGYERAHLWGVSYGTRLALAAATYDVVKSLILESVYPFSKGLYNDGIELYRNSFNTHDRLYRSYRKHYGQPVSDYRSLYRRALSRLQEKPLTLVLKSWKDDGEVAFTLTGMRLLEFSFSTLYSPHLYDAYYTGIEAYAESGEVNDALLLSLEYFVNNIVDDQFSATVYFATECLDGQSEKSDDLNFVFDGFPEVEAYFTEGFAYDFCNDYGFSTELAVSDLKYTSKPTLIVSGEFDPITPPDWGGALEEILPEAQHITLYDTGHAGLKGVYCNWRFLNEFINTGNVNVNIKCMAEPLWP